MRKTFVMRQQWVLVNSSSEDFELAGLPKAALLCFDRLSGVDVNTNAARITFGFKSASTEILLESFASPGVAVVKEVLGKIYLPSGYRPFLRVVTGVAGDQIVLCALGYADVSE
jgi:hypothetical protein